MDEHAARVTQPLRDVYSDFQAGQATLLDLSRVAGQVAMTLDNAHAALLTLLRNAHGDLEYGYYASESEKHVVVAERVYGPMLALIDAE